MTYMRLLSCFTFLMVLVTAFAYSQGNPSFDLATYQTYVATHQDLTSAQLLQLHPAGTFERGATVSPDALNYFKMIDSCYTFTSYERSLLAQRGFVVTDRLRYGSFGEALFEIYNRDLPVFVSTDAILHAIHMSYDKILQEVESALLIPKLDSLLFALRAQLPAMSEAYSSVPAMAPMEHDLDVYLTVAYALLKGSAVPYFPENAVTVTALQNLIAGAQPASYPLFSSTVRTIDFSQFTIRGHYTQSKELGRYFEAMMWLGRTEMYLLGPKGAVSPQESQDIQRQTIDAALLVEALDRAGAFPQLEGIDVVIRMFVGESDNVTLPNMKTLLQRAQIGTALQLLDTLALASLQDTLKSQPFAFQRINSQILMSDNPCKPDNIQPASSVLLLGQRFVIDSYVTGNVVFDKISYQGGAVWRGLPSTLDVLFALGNDAAAQLLLPELDGYHYGTNLSALRYLIDGYDASFWNSSLFNAWLDMIRACNPPSNRSALPSFMTTAAWWQEKMNTQLASWAELRHDNLLYAKQSYTGGVVCSFPKSYVEPIPAFYDAVKSFAHVGESRLVPLLSATGAGAVSSYFSTLESVSGILGSIARKELDGTPLSESEIAFLQAMLFVRMGCGPSPGGWYYSLFYASGEFSKKDYVVADVHTCPTDAAGNMVGWVLHAGTGPLNMAVVTATTPEAGTAAYIGPVLSYFEHVTTNFTRLTDELWSTSYALDQACRPSFVNLYLADSSGKSRGSGPSLLTGVQSGPFEILPSTAALHQNYPNPFNPSTIITYTIPSNGKPQEVRLSVYDLRGGKVRTLFSGALPGGAYATRWDGTNDAGQPVATGVYFCRLLSGAVSASMKMLLLK